MFRPDPGEYGRRPPKSSVTDRKTPQPAYPAGGGMRSVQLGPVQAFFTDGLIVAPVSRPESLAAVVQAMGAWLKRNPACSGTVLVPNTFALPYSAEQSLDLADQMISFDTCEAGAMPLTVQQLLAGFAADDQRNACAWHERLKRAQPPTEPDPDR